MKYQIHRWLGIHISNNFLQLCQNDNFFFCDMAPVAMPELWRRLPCRRIAKAMGLDPKGLKMILFGEISNVLPQWIR